MYMGHHQVAMQAETELRKGPWLEEEDERLIAVVSALGERRWDALAKSSGLRRSGKSCRLRWMNYLRPNLKRGHITAEEAHLIVELHKQWGNRWSRIARRLPGRTDNEIKNYWRSHLRKQASASEQGYLMNNTNSLNNDNQQNSLVMSMQEAVSPCSSNEEWQWDNLGYAYDHGIFQVSCSSPYETRLSDWMCNWPKEEQSYKADEQNINVRHYYESDHLSYFPPEWITGYSGSTTDGSIWDGSLPIWDMD